MVSLWPWKGKDNSPASFEKILSSLSDRITQTVARLDSHRQHARRFKALWTLYTTFAYLLHVVILTMAVGWQNWSIFEYGSVFGCPLLIYVFRLILGGVFDYRISKAQRLLDSLNKQRQEAIEKLKTATKYNSTQQLLEKYGGESPKPASSKRPGKPKRKESGSRAKNPQMSGRTGLPPPPTANIRRPQHESPQLSLVDLSTRPNLPPSTGTDPNFPTPPGVDEPGFAPNAFPTPTQYLEHHHWYDRLLDVLLGEDETLPKNRMALICGACRLVNGQAPPGMKSLEELGRWRCGGCGAWNGVEAEAKKVLEDIQSQSQTQEAAQVLSKGVGAASPDEDATDNSEAAVSISGGTSSGSSEEREAEVKQPDIEPEEPAPVKRRRGRPRANKKG